MWVCHCRRVTDREITSLVREGVDDVETIGQFCGAGTGCGGCHSEIERLVDAGAREPVHSTRAVHRDRHVEIRGREAVSASPMAG
jgi:bacterioferritin-associated ferredoxin